MDALFLGVDGGGTKTRAVVCGSDGRIVGFGEAGGFNLNNLPPETCIANLRAALEGAFGGGPFRPVRAGFFGICTIKDEEDKQAARAVIARTGLRADLLTVENDLVNVLACGIPVGPGVALIAGTGSHVVARDEQDRLSYCGGWGYLIGDVGSGYAIGIQATDAVARAHDGRGPQTSLTLPLLAMLQIATPSALLRAVCDPKLGPHGIAAFAPVVMHEAEKGDPVAVGILQSAAQGLAECVGTAVKRSGLTGEVSVVFAGGVACSGVPFQPMLEAAILEQVSGARFVRLLLPLECGAATMAMRSSGLTITPQTVTNLNSTHPNFR